MGIALGRIGMSYDDFCMLTPEEFNAIYDEWRLEQDSIIKGEWERCRWVCYCMIRPYSKRNLRLTDIMKFDWDGRPSESVQLTKEERDAQERKYEELLKLWEDE
ncbi:MAG: hypothetical protein ACI4TM_08695 [Candidatus Cryptobacteroides sp.]